MTRDRRRFVMTALCLFCAIAAGAFRFQVEENGPNGKLYLPCDIDGRKARCYLDTGANSSTIPKTAEWASYPVKRAGKFKSASGHIERGCDVVVLDELVVGDFSSKKREVLRCPIEAMSGPDPVIGLDVLRERRVRMDFGTREFSTIDRIPGELKARKLVDNSKVISVQVDIAGRPYLAMFDTGATLTVIDREFVAKNPALFEPVDARDSSGKDSANRDMAARPYILKSLMIGERRFDGLLVVAIAFDQFKKVLPSGTPVVLGYNAISRAAWYLDLKGGRWAMARRR